MTMREEFAADCMRREGLIRQQEAYEAGFVAGQRAEREACAVTAWNTGMDLHMKQSDAREIGSLCAAAIRNRKEQA